MGGSVSKLDVRYSDSKSVSTDQDSPVSKDSNKVEKTLLHTSKVFREGIPEGSLRDQVFYLFNKNPLLSARLICEILHIDYKSERGYIYRLKSEWKTLPNFIQGIKRITLHHQHFYGRVLKSLDRRADPRITALAIDKGWQDHRARNKLIDWHDRDGWVKWWESGKIREFVHKPVTEGRKKQILAHAFFATSLIEDLKVFEAWADTVVLHDGHLVYDTFERLPYARIELLNESNSVVVTLGDKSHPTSVELAFSLPRWAEDFQILTRENMAVIKEFNDFFREVSTPRRLDSSKSMIS